jgi:transglutaminase-like putative cysteine protease
MLPSLGWTGFDPTYRNRISIQHIKVAVGRDYNDVPPVCGSYKSSEGNQRMSFELSVRQTADLTLN